MIKSAEERHAREHREAKEVFPNSFDDMGGGPVDPEEPADWLTDAFGEEESDG